MITSLERLHLLNVGLQFIGARDFLYFVNRYLKISQKIKSSPISNRTAIYLNLMTLKNTPSFSLNGLTRFVKCAAYKSLLSNDL